MKSSPGDLIEVKPGTTPLQMMAHAGAVACATLLSESGGSAATYDCDGYTALLVACAPGGPKSGDNSHMVRLLLNAGARANHRGASGFTPLAAAAQSMDLRSLRVLLDCGADIGFSSLKYLLGRVPLY